MPHCLTSILLSAAVMGTSCAGAVELIAHRGASHDAPENTLASFKLGYEQKADADECDVYLSKDGKVVVMHDGNTARTAGISNKIDVTTFADLRRLDVGNWGDWKGKGFSEKIPALEEVLPLIPAGKRLFVEIKSGPEILPELERVLKKGPQKPDQIVIIGFGYETVKKAKALLPHLQVLFLASADQKVDKQTGKKTKQYPPVAQLIQKAKAANLDGLDLEAGFPIDKAFVEEVHKAGLKLFTWTVDDPAVAQKEAAAGVEGITTNRPGWMREQLSKLQQSTQ